MSSRRRVLSILCWLTIEALLARIAAGGALAEVVDAPTAGGAITVLVGLVLVVVGLVVVIALALDAAWAGLLSRAAAAVAAVYGVVLLVAEHESGSLVAAAGVVAALAATLPRTVERVPD